MAAAALVELLTTSYKLNVDERITFFLIDSVEVDQEHNKQPKPIYGIESFGYVANEILIASVNLLKSNGSLKCTFAQSKPASFCSDSFRGTHMMLSIYLLFGL
jgi:hypothetical protein